MQEEFKYIVRNEGYSSGSPRINNRRLTVCNVITSASHSINDCINDFDLKIEEIHEAIVYCKDLHCFKEADKNKKLNFCCNCTLSSYANQYEEEIEEFYQKIPRNKSVSEKKNYIEDNLGYRTWKIAEKLYEHIIINKNSETNFDISELG